MSIRSPTDAAHERGVDGIGDLFWANGQKVKLHLLKTVKMYGIKKAFDCVPLNLRGKHA